MHKFKSLKALRWVFFASFNYPTHLVQKQGLVKAVSMRKCTWVERRFVYWSC